MFFILILLAVAIGLAIGRKYSPKSKLNKFLMAFLLPLISGFVIALLFASMNNSPFGFWYKLGQAMAPIISAVVAMIITLFVKLKVKDRKATDTKPIEKKVQSLHYGTDENRVDFEMELTEKEIEKMEELSQREPERWLDNDLELVKVAKKELMNGDSARKEVAQDTLKAIEVQVEASNSKEESDQHKEQLVDDLISGTKTEVKTDFDKKEIENKGSILSKWLKTLLIIILFFGILFGLSVLTSFVYIRYVYPSKAKSIDERLIQEANANPSKAYEIAQVLFDREENGHQSEYHDFLSGKQGTCNFDHLNAGKEAASIYCQYCIDSAQKDISHSNKIVGDMLFKKADGHCDELYYKTGIEILKYAANEGDSKAQVALGGYYGGIRYNKEDDDWYWGDYYTIDGKNIDHSKQAYWYLQAANQGNSTAMGNLGDAYMRGEGVVKDVVKGLEWIQKAANLDNAWFQRVLGDYYRDGIVVQTGTHKVVTGYYWDWDDDEYGNFGKHRHANIKTVTDYKTILAPDIKQAQYWWKKAADNGDEDAKERLQQIYE